MTTAGIVWLVVILGSITGMITIFSALNVVRAKKEELNQRKDIVRSGEPAMAVIRQITETSSSMDDRPGVRMVLTVTPDNESSFDAIVETYIPVLKVPQFQEGREVAVRYKYIGGKRVVEVADAYIP